MPREVRRIVFSHSETASAIINYGKKFNMSFPENGKLLKAVYSTAPEFEISAIKQMQESHQARIAEQAVERGYSVAARVHTWVFGNVIGK